MLSEEALVEDDGRGRVDDEEERELERTPSWVRREYPEEPAPEVTELPAP